MSNVGDTTDPIGPSDAAADRRVVSVVIPVFKNSESIPELCRQLAAIELPHGIGYHVVFVVDGSPDDSADVLRAELRSSDLTASIVTLSRNFGSFAAIRAGLEHAVGDYFVVISADLQEPPQLIPSFVERLDDGDVDLVLGEREGRADPLVSRFTASVFWRLYRRWIQPSMPRGGVDVFACNAAVRSTILTLDESNSSLVGQLLWIGFRRTSVRYERRARPMGKSAWTLSKKLRYMSDSIFAFTDLPIRFLLLIGVVGSVLVTTSAAVVGAAWLISGTEVPGYTPLMLAILLVGFVMILGLGIVGSYVWRAYENTKRRPLTITRSVEKFDGS